MRHRPTSPEVFKLSKRITDLEAQMSQLKGQVAALVCINDKKNPVPPVPLFPEDVVCCMCKTELDASVDRPDEDVDYW